MSESKEQVSLGERARSWWRDLQENPGDRAALRRCTSPREAVFVPATLNLMLRLGWTRRPDGERDWMADRIAAIAIVLAAIREDRPGGSVARQIGKKGEGKPVLNEAKLRGLLAAETPEELLPEMLTLVRLSGGAVNVADIAESILWWNHPSGRTQRRWLYDYHDIPLASEAAATNNA